MKLVSIFVPSYNSFMKTYIDNIVECLSINDKVVVHGVETGICANDNIALIVDTKLKYLYNNNDPRIYENFLNYSSEINADIIFIPRLSHPEFLYSELRVRKIDSEIIFSVFAFELFSNSKARRELLIDLICTSIISRVLIHSILGKHLQMPFNYRASEFITKIKFLPEPMYECSNDYLLPINQFTHHNKKTSILYFGNVFYGKGVDLLLAASRIVKSGIKIIVAGDFDKINFDFDISKFKGNDGIEIIDKFISNEEMMSLFCNCDIVVLPYRKTYENGTSGVFVQAMMAGKPVVVPDIYPFNATVELYSCGTIFKAEDINDLANKLDEISMINRELFKKGIDHFRCDLMSWQQFASFVIE